MPTLSLRPTHKAVRAYYEALHQLGQLRLGNEGQVAPAFADLLGHCARQVGWTLAEQFTLRRRDKSVRVDGAMLDEFRLVHGLWEAKDSADDLPREVQRKRAAGYPTDNILFQAPERLILWQDGRQVLDVSITEPEPLVEALQQFFGWQPPAFEAWEQAVAEFREQVPQLAAGLLALIGVERRANKTFVAAFEGFAALVRESVNPNISVQALEEMLIQHLLTERLFRRVFRNPDFVHNNVIAREIETVIRALTSRTWSRDEWLRSLDRFYGAIETTAGTIDDFSHKQEFLNTVYEQFFQGFSVRVADTHGIVYTPQPIVAFMVRSVEALLRQEWGRGLGDEGVQVLDPFVGTGNFLLRVMQAIPRTRLAAKYAGELHANEVMLLPYYIASMNIEHLFYDLTGEYRPFEGICLVDTFELAREGEGQQMRLMVAENTERVLRQQKQPLFVILGNPPYNAWQLNENDNNRNRKYDLLDARVSATYTAASTATNKNALSDPYVKAFRWASDRIGEEGIVAFITNNSFLEDKPFDGMRKHLEEEFDALYLLDLGGNVRRNPKLSGMKHNVFGIQVGVSIAFLVRRAGNERRAGRAEIFYARTDPDWRKGQKLEWLEQRGDVEGVEWQRIEPNRKNIWVNEGMEAGFDAFVPIGSKDSKSGKTDEAIFGSYSAGAQTNRDAWAYNFSRVELTQNMSQMIGTYNNELDRWHNRIDRTSAFDDFVLSDDRAISWSSSLKASLRRYRKADFSEGNIRQSLYRPFSKQFLYYDSIFTHRPGLWSEFLPSTTAEKENLVICVTNHSQMPFVVLMTNIIPSQDVGGRPTQCFPLYIYDADGGNRRDNITDWALEQFRTRYQIENQKSKIENPDIFYYTYALLHHPDYRERYAANLRRELPRLLFAPAFRPFAEAGRALAALHVGYEAQPEYPLRWIETPGQPLDWRVEKMRLSKEGTQLRVNDFLTLDGIPPEAHDYRLGNRSALGWLVDQLRVKVDARSGIRNDPNRADAPETIARLAARLVTVSVETVRIVRALPPLG